MPPRDLQLHPNRIWLSAPVVGSVVVFTLLIAGMWFDLRSQVRGIKDALDPQVRWTAPMMHTWTSRLADQNPTLRVPSSRSIQEDLRPPRLGAISTDKPTIQ